MKNLTVLFSVFLSLYINSALSAGRGDGRESVTQAGYDFELARVQNLDLEQIQPSSFPGENILKQNLDVNWNTVDLFIPGNGPDIYLGRTYRKFQNGKITGASVFADSPFGTGWGLNIPKVTLVNFASSASLLRYCDSPLGSVRGIRVEINGVSGFSEISQNSSLDYPSDTFMEFENNWLLICEPYTSRSNTKNPNGSTLSKTITKGLTLLSPNGVKYRFTHYSQESFPIVIGRGDITGAKTLYVSDIEDRFGNYVTFNYRQFEQVEGNEVDIKLLLTSITSSDGRNVSVVFNSDNSTISKVNFNGKSINYSYFTQPYKRLKSVTLPENRTWSYTYYTNNQVIGGSSNSATSVAGSFLSTVTAPEGAKIKYTYGLPDEVTVARSGYGANSSFIGHTYVRGECSPLSTFLPIVLTERLVDTGLETYEYTYGWLNKNDNAYSRGAGNGSFFNQTEDRVSILRIVTPDGIEETTYNCIGYADVASTSVGRYGELAELKLAKLSSDYKLISETITNWKLLAEGAGTFRSSYTWAKGTPRRTVIDSKVTYQYNSSGHDKDKYVFDYLSYDAFGNPLLVKESNDFNGKLKYTKASVYNDSNNWLIGLPKTKSISSNGSSYQLVHETQYYSGTGSYKSLPKYEISHGRWYKKYHAYWTTGTQAGLLKTILYPGSNRQVDYLDYKRGIARHIQRPMSESSTLEHAYLTVDNDGNITRSTDFENNCTDYSYNGSNWLVRINPCNNFWLDTVNSYTTTTSNEGYGYVEAGMFKKSTIQGSYRKLTYFDSLRRPRFQVEYDTTKRASSIKYRRFNYDSENRVTFESQPMSQQVTARGINLTYDVVGRVLSRDDNTTAGSITYTYETNNRVRINNNRGHTTEYTYLAYGTPELNDITKVSSPNSTVTTIKYSTFGNLTSISQGGLTEYRVYDSYQSLCKKVRKDIGNQSFSYDSVGLLQWSAHGGSVNSSTTSCDNNVYSSEKTTYQYNNHALIQKVSYGDNTHSKIFTYDKNDNLTKLEFGDVRKLYTYDDLLNIKTERLLVDNIDWIVRYKRNSYGHLDAIQYPGGGTLGYSPNALGETTNVGVFASNVLYHPNGSVKSFKHQNGCTNTLTLHASGLPNVQRATCKGVNAVYNQYSWDANANLTYWDDKQSNSFDLRFTYDGLDRLDNIRKANNSLIGDMNYDTMGNITKFDSIAGTINYQYDSNSKSLLSTTGYKNYSFSYDARGNIEDNGYHTFDYNLANQMQYADNNHYTYDGNDKRVKTVDDSGTRYSFYSTMGTLLLERINGVNREYYYLGNQLIAQQGSGSKKYIHHDILGNSAAISNSNGDIISRHRYAPYGKSWGHSQENEIGYTGHKFDESIGLSYMQARYYDPVIGRFYSNDPVDALGHLSTPNGIHGFNRYAYANNNPYKYVDPNGETTALAAGIGGTIVCGPICGGIAFFGTAILTGYALSEIADDGDGATSPDREAGSDGKKGSTGGPGAGKRFKPETPEQKAENEGALCRYCGTETTNEPGHPNSRERDHIDPKSRGGNNSSENEGQSCRSCNRSKGARNPDEWQPQQKEQH